MEVYDASIPPLTSSTRPKIRTNKFNNYWTRIFIIKHRTQNALARTPYTTMYTVVYLYSLYFICFKYIYENTKHGFKNTQNPDNEGGESVSFRECLFECALPCNPKQVRNITYFFTNMYYIISFKCCD